MSDDAGDPSDQAHSIFALIHELHSTITKSIDTSLSWDQLNSPPVNYTVIRPIVERLNPSPSPTPGEKRNQHRYSGRTLTVPSKQRSEEDGHGHKVLGEGGMGLGMVLYALMANR